MKRPMVILLVAILVATTVASCAPTSVAPIDERTPIMPANDLEGGQRSFEHFLEEENLLITTVYSSNYPTTDWHVTDTKSVDIELKVKSTEGITPTSKIEILVENMHADISLQACCVNYSATLDGWSVDSMDDRLHTGTQPGFYVTEKHPYEETFIIEGFSEPLLQGWGYFANASGWAEVEQSRLDEERLVKKGGVYATKLHVVFDILLMDPESGLYYKKVIDDELLIPVAGGEKWLKGNEQ